MHINYFQAEFIANERKIIMIIIIFPVSTCRVNMCRAYENKSYEDNV